MIRRALEEGDVITIGLTTDEMAKSIWKDHEVASFSERKRELEEFLKKMKALEKIRIIPIKDPYGTTLTDNEIDKIIVSRDTAERAMEINELRRKKGLKPLKIIVVNMILAEDRIPISTTRIRQGEIDREGHLL